MSFELMDCNSIKPLISAYYDGDVTPEERALVERHLARCEGCSRALAEYRVIGGDLRALSVPAPPVGLRRDVWRAIEAQERRGLFGSPAPAPRPRAVVTAPPPREQGGKGLISVLMGGGGAWAKALPAALLLVGLLVVMAFVLIMRNTPLPVAAVELEEKGELTDYGKPVYVVFNKPGVVGADAEEHTDVLHENAPSPYTLTTEVKIEFINLGNGKGKLEIRPQPTWIPGARYAVVVDAPNIGLGVGNAKLDTVVHKLSFGAAEHTPTPTNTPTETPIPTNTPIPPSNTPAPTAVAEETPKPGVEPTRTVEKPVATATRAATNTPALPRPSATGGASSPTSTPTPVSPTGTPAFATPVPLPVTATPRATQTPGTPTVLPTLGLPPTVTPGVVRTATPTPGQTSTPNRTPTQGSTVATPRATGSPTATGTPAPTYGCELAPVRGFGKVWQTNSGLRERVGCPEAREIGIADMVVQRFELGLMVWRGDTRMIYVFKGGPRDTLGTWRQFRDNWTETEPTPRPQATPPAGMFEPERGFGKVWRENPDIKRDLGWATERERPAGGAWQEFQRANALWTTDRQIYFMYGDGLWERFDDTFGE